MSSRYGTVDLAGVSIGSSIWMPIYTGLSGILLAITPIVSQLVGAKKRWMQKGSPARHLCRHIAGGPYFTGLFFGIDWILSKMNLESAVHSIAKATSMRCVLVFYHFSYFCDALLY